MKPIKFKQANETFTSPEPGIQPLPAFMDGKVVLSCWRLGFWDRVRAVLFGRVWLNVRYGNRPIPPTWLSCERSAFK